MRLRTICIIGALIALYPAAAMAGPDDLAVVIANGRYADATQSARFAHRDGEAFAKAAVDVLGIDRARLRIVEDANAEALRRLFAGDGEIAALLHGRPKARLIIYFSGAGSAVSGKGYLLPVDVPAAKAATDGYALGALVEDGLQRVGTEGQLLMFIEAAGAVAGASAGLPNRAGLAVLAAARGGEPAFQDEPAAGSATKGREHGVFTDALLDGLYGLAANSAREITIASLERFVARRMADRLAVLFPGQGRTQAPELIAADPTLVVARLPASPVYRDPTAAALEDRECRLLVTETDPAPIDAFLASCRLCLCADALKAHATKLRQATSAAAADCEADRRLWPRYQNADAQRLQQFIDVARCPSVVAEAKAALALALAATAARPAPDPQPQPQPAPQAAGNEQAPKALPKGPKSASAGEVAPAPGKAGAGTKQPPVAAGSGDGGGASRQQAPDPTPAPNEQSAGAADKAQLVHAIHKELRRVGCDPGGQAAWGKSMQRALEAFQRIARTKLDVGEPSEAVLAAIQARRGRVCPLQCDDDEIVVNNECRPRPAPPKAQHKAAPKTAEPKHVAPKAKAKAHDDDPPPKRTVKGGAGGGGDCPSYMFNGQVCTDARGRTCVQRFHQRICTY